MDLEMNEDNANMNDVHASNDNNMAPCSTIHALAEDCTNSGLYGATSDIISNCETLVTLVCHYVREEQPLLEIMAYMYSFFLIGMTFIDLCLGNPAIYGY